MSTFQGFIGGAYQMDSLPISAQRCINWYPETQIDDGASTVKALQPSPGYIELLNFDDEDLPTGSFTRGIYRTSRGLGLVPENGGSIIAVVGPRVYWLKKDNNGDWIYEQLGDEITNSTAKVSMVDDGFGLCIADGTNIYRIDLTTKEFVNVGYELQQPKDVDFMGGYTVTIGTDENDETPQNTFFWSGLYDNATWNALDYASAEQSQDPITAMIVAGSYIYFLGPQSYELWSPTGDADLPFNRAYASSGSIGIYAPKSLCKFGNNIFMLGSNGGGQVAAYMSQGTEMMKISTIALEQEWGKNVTDDCTTWTDSHDGHDFVYFNFDALDKTYAYDIRENEWSERASRDEMTDTLHRWEPNFVVHRGGDTIVGDRYSTKLYLMGKQYTTEAGSNIMRIRTTSHVNAEQKMIRFDAVRFDMETGNGITNEDAAGRYTKAPTMMFRYSHDRARTWSSEQRQKFGATGQYGNTVEFRRLGAARNLTVEFKISDPCLTSILNGFLYATVAQRGRRS